MTEQIRPAALVLAAGKGTRMKSELPKVLHPVCGRPMLEHILDCLGTCGISNQHICLVLGGDLEAFAPILQNRACSVVEQHQRRGTGDAVASTALAFSHQTPPPYTDAKLLAGGDLGAEDLIICAGDTPALRAEILEAFIQQCRQKNSDLAVIGMNHPEPTGYGRLLVNDQQELLGIIEEKDATAEQKRITLCNTGVIYAKRALLFDLLSQITCNNAQGEYYLTDCFGLARKQAKAVDVFSCQDFQSFAGVNRRDQLAAIEAWMIAGFRAKHMESGVSFQLPETVYLEDQVTIGTDTTIGSGCAIFRGATIGSHCIIGPNCVIYSGATISDGTIISAGTICSAKA